MADYRYFKKNKEDPYGLLPLQHALAEIVDYIDEFCGERQIKYFLMGGSALGALRHGGFIPWDDDLDIFMLHEDYDKFVSSCKTELDTSRFYFQEGGTPEQPHYFCKLRMNGTMYLEEERKGADIHHGIFVDIMCLNNAPASVWHRKVQYYAAGLLKARACTKTAYRTDSMLKKIQLLIARLVVNEPMEKMLLCMVTKYNKISTPFVAHLFGRAKFSASFYPAKNFELQRYVPFEEMRLPVPGGAEEYLTIRFGENYMEIPDAKTLSLYKAHTICWDTGSGDKETSK